MNRDWISRSCRANSLAELISGITPANAQVKGYPFEVAIPDGLPVSGSILADQVRTSTGKRRATRICKLPDQATDEVLGKLSVLLQRMR